ncbi:MAG TPA: hypothetical protein VMM55_00660 [Thermohalobaculum sp.]|nr:hypothetical protein [Thermohalobaculum sp.]
MSTEARFPETRFPTRAEIDWHVARGRQLRAEATAEALRAVGIWIRARAGAPGSPFRRRPAADAGSALPTSLRPPLTAIRSAAEILHDHPDMAPQERARFVRILLDEERRLERLLAALAPGEVGRLAR